MSLRQIASALTMVSAAMLLAGCSNNMSDLEAYIAEINARPGGRIEPLPEIKEHVPFAYEAYDLRSPFVPERRAAAATGPGAGGLRPDSARTREYLEQFPLDTLNMVGTLTKDGQLFGLLQTTDTLVHRVSMGNYVGQNDGKIIAIDDSEIRVVEIIPDGIGGYMERPATISLGEK
jgi:type IV pilus assembly protein PilP